MDEPDKSADEALGALYRGLPRDTPPPALDVAILEAAKRSVAVRPARRWAVPVSLAAVLVLSVSVTLHVVEEQPEGGSAPAALPVPEATKAPAASPAPAALPAPAELPAPVAAESAPVPEARKPVAVPAAKREDRAEDRGPAPVAQPAPAAVPAFVPEPAPAPAAAPASAGLASADRAKRSMEAQHFAPPAEQAPGPWLEAIAHLRAQGRHEEADTSLAAFRRRYPEFEIPLEMQRRIAPPR